jgi:hypothetical protein
MHITTYEVLNIIRPHVSGEVYNLIEVELKEKATTKPVLTHEDFMNQGNFINKVQRP